MEGESLGSSDHMQTLMTCSVRHAQLYDGHCTRHQCPHVIKAAQALPL